MKFSPRLAAASKVLLALAGCFCLHLILRDLGYERIQEDLNRLRWNFLPVVISFLLPFSFLALAWWVLEKRPQPLAFLFLVSLVANAWNNMGPVSKSLGEPTRVLILRKKMPLRDALRNMMLFNLAQSSGTLLVFGIGAFSAPLFFPLQTWAFIICLGSGGLVSFLVFIFCYWLLRRPKPQTYSRRKIGFLRWIFHWLRWTSHQIRKQTRAHPYRFAFAVAFAAAARVSEGVVFYVIFKALDSPLSLWEATVLDIGRGIADNAFFFVPYQLGTREYSLLFLTEFVLGRGKDSAVAASLVFRMGEIVWIGLGFLVGLFFLRKRTPK